MINTKELRDKVATLGSNYLTDKEWIEIIDRLEAAEKDIALKERIIDSIGSTLNAVPNEQRVLCGDDPCAATRLARGSSNSRRCWNEQD